MTAEETMAVQAAPKTSLEAQNQSKGILAGEARLETALRRLEEQSALQTVLAKKRLFYARLSAAFLAVTAIAVVWMVGQVIPQMERTLGTANTTMADVDLVMQQLAMADIPGIIENLDQTLSEGRESIAEASDALQQVSSIDFAGLNKAIQELQGVLENPLGSLIGWKK